jgi:excinuclease UvrABC ATPase subunit
LGNTLIVVEHDEETIRTADWIVDIGPGAGEHGGKVVVSGDYQSLIDSKESITGAYLSGRKSIAIPSKRRPIDLKRQIVIKGAKENNLKNVDVELPLGTFICVTGVSGSGKSTLADILLGLRRPLAGSVEWAGIDIVADPAAIRPRRRRYQKLHQDPIKAFVPHLTFTRQFLSLEDVKSGLSVARDLPPLLEKLKVGDRLMSRRPSEVSGGEAQRLALARILLLDPIAIIADEPTSRLDPVVQRSTMMLLRQVVDERGLAMILISHNLALSRAVADDELILGTNRHLLN